MSTSTAPKPSRVWLPEEHGARTLLAFLVERFPRIEAEVWRRRLAEGRVRFSDGEVPGPESPYRGGRHLLYFREVDAEPFAQPGGEILVETDHFLVADKPHQLPVAPGGRYVNECLLYRLRRETGLSELAPVHRLDLDTAGLVLFSKQWESRPLYAALFAQGAIQRIYRAVASLSSAAPEAGRHWTVEGRIEPGDPWFRRRFEPSQPANSRTEVRWLRELAPGLGLFELTPTTGKTHQLRLHMASLGFGIQNDRLYPELLDEADRSGLPPLQLLAERLAFRDPVSKRQVQVASRRQLLHDTG